MSFSSENGYIPESFNDIMGAFRLNVNSIFNTTYDENSFIGTDWYKYLYAPTQKAVENENKTAEIFLKLQSYIAMVNEKISAPAVSYGGIVSAFKTAGFKVGLKPIGNSDAGKAFICADVDDEADDYADIKLQLAQIVKKNVVGGVVSQGSEVESLPIGNGQNFDFKFSLPNRIPVKLRATIYISDNNSMTIPTTEQINEAIFENVNALYQVGINFEPQRYFNQSNAPWADSVLLEWSDDDGATWDDMVYVASFEDKFEIELAGITTVINS